MIFLAGASEIHPEALGAAVRYARYLLPTDARGDRVSLIDVDDYEVFSTRRAVQMELTSPEPTLASAFLMSVSYSITVARCQCLLPEDCVRGLLGLCDAPDSLQQSISSAQGVEATYTRFTRYVLSATDPNETHRWWDFLSLAFSPRVIKLPSWVPDFHQGVPNKIEPAPIHVFGAHRKSLFQASSRKTRAEIAKQRDELLLYGKLVSEVVQVLAMAPGRGPGEPLLEANKVPKATALSELCIFADWMEMADAHLHKRRKIPSLEYSTMPDDAIVDQFWKMICIIRDDDNVLLETDDLPSKDYFTFRVHLEKVRSIAARCSDPAR